ncbi:MAG TPA: hypothetical protein VHC72_14395, partial [Bryobacteraceae bacterium]|nr:hypothetical protein [Bryobacteraceae bacterium]
MKKGFVMIAGAMAASAALHAQSPSEGPATFQFAVASGPRQVFTYSTIGGPVVTGRPYSATEERKSSQTLGDGTHIETNETNRVFRDEQGRTRVERKDGGISIYDPVAGFSAQLDPSTRTATKMTVMVRTTSSDDAKLKLAEGLRAQIAEREKTLSDKNPQVRELQSKLAEVEKGIAEQRVVRIKVPAPESGEPQFRPRAVEAGHLEVTTVTEGEHGEHGGATVAYATGTAAGPTILRVDAGNNGSVETLPSQLINGVLAQGTRTTETIPVGKIGNDRVINVVSERWYSNDLQMLVKSTSSDPRFGES